MINLKIELSVAKMEELFHLYTEKKISDVYIATWLATVYFKGLTEN
jgi:thymidine phosphorylase